MKNHGFYTSYKAFDKPPFNDLELAKKGAHYERLMVALESYGKRPHQSELLIGGLPKHLSDTFITDGIILLDEWADPKMHKELLQTALSYPAHMNKHPHVNLVNQRPDCLNWFLHKSKLKDILACCLKMDLNDLDFSNQYTNNTFIQKVEFDGENNDEQQFAHMDTFFPALKFWYFPEDVEAEYGAFSYAKGSPNIFKEAAFGKWYNEQIISVIDGSYDWSRGRGTPEGSIRITVEEMESFGLTYEPVSVKANTLVIGNVMGFHGRGTSKKPLTRTAIHGSIRPNQPME